MRFIKKIDSLYIDIIVGLFCDGLLGEFLYVHNRDEISTGVVSLAGRTNVFDKVFLGVHFLHKQPSSAEFIGRLCEQVKPVYYKIEFCNNALPLIIIFEITHVKERKCRLTAALRMPDDTVLYSRVQLAF
ncbi:hypothetical protein SDC9_171075 [bioreactor metagenome]|uniref:Uncharacterized protein n=1 Tax=bioreactor metagenome TaxID=1076179 RepID=A0A645GCH1_9ZZZZ